MLQGTQSADMRASSDADEVHEAGVIDFDRILAAVRRQWRLVALAAVLGGLLAAAYIATAVPLYTAYSSVLIDKSSNRIVNELALSEQQASSLTDEIAIASQAEVMKSEQLASKVAQTLGLIDNEEFLTPTRSVLGTAKSLVFSLFDVASWFGSEEEESETPEARLRKAVDILTDNLSVTRVGGTTVMALSYTSPSPEMAAKVAQTYAETYITDQLDSKFEATRRAGGWLQGRIEELRQRSLASDQTVQKFRADNGLMTTDGRLISDQQLADLNTQLSEARSEVAVARARYESTRTLVESGDVNSVVADSFTNTVISTLRTRYLEASKRESEISRQLGENHLQAVRLRGEMGEYAGLMFGELRRLADSYQNDLRVAEAREAAADTAVKSAIGVSTDANRLQVQLRELEREADTYRNLYQTFLQRYQQAIQQQSFPITEARVISAAYAPDKPSKPRKALVVALGMFLGGAVGAGFGTLREYRDRFFRTGDEVREELGLELMGLVPSVRPVASPRRTPEEVLAAKTQRVLAPANNLGRYVNENPFSSFAEALRSAKIAVDISVERSGAKVIGVVSVLPGEGKSTIAANLGSLLAGQGHRTLLVDADLRKPGLTRALADDPEQGLQDLILDRKQLAEVAMSDPETGMVMLPVSKSQRIVHTSEFLGSAAMSTMLSNASKDFDYVVVDLPPMAPIVDVRAITQMIDAFIVVVEWGGTSRRMVRATLRDHPLVMEKCVGVILNKVDNDKMKLYRAFGSKEFYSSRYSEYYSEGV